MKKLIHNEFSLRLTAGPSGLQPAALAKALSIVARALQNMALDTDQERVDLRVLRLQMASPLTLTIGCESEREVAHSLVEGLRSLSQRARLPDGMSPATITCCRELALLQTTFDLLEVAVRAGGETEVTVDLRVAVHAEELVPIRGQPHSERTTLAGILLKPGGRQAGFELWDRVSRRRILGEFRADELRERVSQDWGGRVEVFGVAEFDALGDAVSVVADDIVAINPPPMSIYELQNIRFTAGEDHADYVRDLREDD